MDSDAMAARIENLLGSSSAGSGANPPLRPPPIPDHDILARIGSGSYGEVWLARSVTGALRAVKVVWRSRFSNERPYEREFRGIVQFEPISRSHPGVVNVLHVGRDDTAGCFFYVMELADDARKAQKPEIPLPNESRSHEAGIKAADASALQNPALYWPRTLASELKSRGRLPVADVVALGVQLAGALGHLHRHGLVHRDVKPSNVIFVHGQAKLADIGLVTGVDEERSFVGTEGFIPPEGPGSERADLFALGRLIYEAATGKNRSDFPGLPDDLDRWPKDERERLIELNEILARACAPEARKRHSNAAELAGDLNLILAGRSVRRAYRMERRLRSARIVSIAAIILVLIAVFSNWLQRRQREFSDARARREAALREEAQKSLARAEAAEAKSHQQLYNALVEQAHATVLTGEFGQRTRALEAIHRATAISNSAALRGVAVSALALPDLRFERQLPVPSDATLVQFDPGFERVAINHSNGPIEILSVPELRLLSILPASTKRQAFGAQWSRDGRFLAAHRDLDGGGRLKDIEVWDVPRTNRVLLLQASPWGAFTFHPRLPRLMVGRATNDVVTWDLESGQEIESRRMESQPVVLKFSPNGASFATVHGSGRRWTVSIYDTASGALRTNRLFTGWITDLDWHPTGRWIGIPDHGGDVHLLDSETGVTRVLGQHTSDAVVAAFSPDGRYLFTGGWDRRLICWDLNSMRRAFAVELDCYRIQFRADGRQCALVGWRELRVELHAFEKPALHREFAEDLGGHRNYAAFSPDGRWLAASGAGEHVLVWNLEGSGPAALVKKAFDVRVSFAPNGDFFANRLGDAGRWRLTETTNGGVMMEKRQLAKPSGSFSLCLTPNGVVFTGDKASAFSEFDQLQTPPAKWNTTVGGWNGASPDGHWLGVYRPGNPHLYVYRLPGFERVAKLTNQARISQFEFSPRGDEVAVGNRSGVEFWSTTTWQRTRHLTNFNGILYSHDARMLWLWTRPDKGGLYDAQTTEPLLLFPGNTLPLALSADGRQLAVSVDGRRVQVWDLVEVRQRLRDLGLDWRE